jgi:hypothetical protein
LRRSQGSCSPCGYSSTLFPGVAIHHGVLTSIRTMFKQQSISYSCGSCHRILGLAKSLIIVIYPPWSYQSANCSCNTNYKLTLSLPLYCSKAYNVWTSFFKAKGRPRERYLIPQGCVRGSLGFQLPTRGPPPQIPHAHEWPRMTGNSLDL